MRGVLSSSHGLHLYPAGWRWQRLGWVFPAGHSGEGEVRLRCRTAQLEALHDPLDGDLVRGEVRQVGQQLGGVREDGGGGHTVDTVTDTLHHLAQFHGSSELQDSAQLDLLRLSEA